MASHCCFENIACGKYVVSQDQEGSSLFVVQSGTLRVEINQDGAKRQLAFFGKGDFFGERALEDSQGKRTANIIANPGDDGGEYLPFFYFVILYRLNTCLLFNSL